MAINKKASKIFTTFKSTLPLIRIYMKEIIIKKYLATKMYLQ